MPTATTSRKGIGGPKTPEGKRRVSLNAMKHGLTASSNQGLERIAETIGTDFETILDLMRTYYFPRDPIDDMLVTKIARCAWRLKITRAMEDRALDRQMTLRPSKWLEQISILERRIDIQLHRAMAALAAKRREEQQEKAQNKLPEVPFPGVTYPWSRRESVPPEPPPTPATPGSQPDTRDIIGRPAPARAGTARTTQSPSRGLPAAEGSMLTDVVSPQRGRPDSNCEIA